MPGKPSIYQSIGPSFHLPQFSSLWIIFIMRKPILLYTLSACMTIQIGQRFPSLPSPNTRQSYYQLKTYFCLTIYAELYILLGTCDRPKKSDTPQPEATSLTAPKDKENIATGRCTGFPMMFALSANMIKCIN